jgi:hypothetical protein
LTTKEAAPAASSQGLFLDGRRQMVFNSARVIRNFQSTKEHGACASISNMEDPECLIASADEVAAATGEEVSVMIGLDGDDPDLTTQILVASAPAPGMR